MAEQIVKIDIQECEATARKHKKPHILSFLNIDSVLFQKVEQIRGGKRNRSLAKGRVIKRNHRIYANNLAIGIEERSRRYCLVILGPYE